MTPTLHTLYAPWHHRMAAYLIDVAILFFPWSFFVALSGITESDVQVPSHSSAISAWVLLEMAYYVFFLSRPPQATPGMRLVGMQMSRLTGHPLKQHHALEWYLAFLLPCLPLYTSLLPPSVSGTVFMVLNIAWFAPLFTLRIGLHDRLCNLRMIQRKLV